VFTVAWASTISLKPLFRHDDVDARNESVGIEPIWRANTHNDV